MNKDLYLDLCVEIPNMLIHMDGELDVFVSDYQQGQIFVRGDGDIEVYMNDGDGGGVIDNSDRDELMEQKFDKDKVCQMIKDKINFAYQLCFEC